MFGIIGEGSACVKACGRAEYLCKGLGCDRCCGVNITDILIEFIIVYNARCEVDRAADMAVDTG